MKSLTQHINESPVNWSQPVIGWDFDNWLDINNIIDVTEDVINAYMSMTWDRMGVSMCNEHASPDTIMEMLVSISIDKLVKHLRKRYCSIKIEHTFQSSDRPGTVLGIPRDLYMDRKSFEQFCDDLKVMQWYFSDYEGSDGDIAYIYIEPVLADKKTDYIKRYCGGKIYHLCRKELTDKILKSGLRTKGEDTKPNPMLLNNPMYRKFPNRSFFFYIAPGQDFLDAIILTGRMFNRYVDIITIRNNFDLIRVDLNRASYLELYKDPAGTDNAVYTYAYIPPKFIEKVNF